MLCHKRIKHLVLTEEPRSKKQNGWVVCWKDQSARTVGCSIIGRWGYLLLFVKIDLTFFWLNIFCWKFQVPQNLLWNAQIRGFRSIWQIWGYCPRRSRDCLEHEVSDFDVPRRLSLDHEKVASKIQKALNWPTGCGKTIRPSLNMPMEHPKRTCTRRFDHIWGLVHCLPDRDLG